MKRDLPDQETKPPLTIRRYFFAPGELVLAYVRDVREHFTVSDLHMIVRHPPPSRFLNYAPAALKVLEMTFATFEAYLSFIQNPYFAELWLRTVLPDPADGITVEEVREKLGIHPRPVVSTLPSLAISTAETVLA